MDLKALLVRENDRLEDFLTRICSDLTDAQVNFAHEAIDERGIANVVVHLYGAVANRAELVAGMGGGQEQPEVPRTVGGLIEFIEGTHHRAAVALSGVTDAQLEAKVTTRNGQEVAGLEVLMQGLAHAHRHVGSVLDARHLGGFETHALG